MLKLDSTISVAMVSDRNALDPLMAWNSVPGAQAVSINRPTTEKNGNLRM
jgi:hypothetical protein